MSELNVKKSSNNLFVPLTEKNLKLYNFIPILFIKLK